MDLDAEGIKDPLSFVFNYFLRLSLYVRTVITVHIMVQSVVIILSKSILSPPFDGSIIIYVYIYINGQESQIWTRIFVYFYMCTNISTCRIISQKGSDDMAISDAQKRATAKYKEKNLKRIPLDVQKEKYEQIKAASEKAGESVNGYIKHAIDERMKIDKEKESTANTENILFQVQAGEKEPINAHAAKMGESLNGFILRAICETIERDLN